MKKSLESTDGSCPYCGSIKNHSKGMRYNKRNFICLECGHLFNMLLPFVNEEYISFHLVKRAIRFPLKLQIAMPLNEGDRITFFWNKGFFIKKELNGLQVYLKQKNVIDKTLATTSGEIAEFLRFEFGIQQTAPAIFELNPQTFELMGIIKKGDIRKVSTHERINYNASPFLAVRANGSVYISAMLRDILKLEPGDWLMLYENAGDYFVYVGEREKDIVQDGFRLSRAGMAGFSYALTVSMKELAVFLCDKYKHELGSTFRIETSELIKIEGREMVKLKKEI